jgi:hypothetical protein
MLIPFSKAIFMISYTSPINGCPTEHSGFYTHLDRVALDGLAISQP